MSFLDDLRTVRDQVERDSTICLPVPPAGRLAIRFRPPEDRDKLTPYIGSMMTNGALTSDQELQLIVDCCDEIGRRVPGSDPMSIEPYEGGPLTFNAGDERWADDGDAPGSARECVRRLFNLDAKPLAAAGVAAALMGWLQGIQVDALEDAEGKSGGSGTS